MTQTHTIDIGIDLGTTNSAIAVMEDGHARVVPNNQNRPVTPSVVRIRSNGATDVGDQAYSNLGLYPEETYGEFKRAMGDPFAEFVFASSGQRLRPPELSALVLKSLLGNVRTHVGIDPRAAVITVPAAFDLAQCAATQEAGRLAGLENAPLVQEPVAASLAYGYAQALESGRWLVFDLGGGTFDLALVGVKDGRIHVLDHGGDNFLGGKDFDWAIVERLFLAELAREYDVRSFQRGNAERRPELGLLKARAEELKIALSATTVATATVESGRRPLLDDLGREISLDITVTREQLYAASKHLVDRAIKLSREVVSRNPGMLDSVLLVGGPTLMPDLRRRIEVDLDAAANTSVNPLTAVAEGAAIYAAAQPIGLARGASHPTVSAARSESEIEIRVASVTDDSETPVAIRVNGDGLAGIEIAASDGSWHSGLIPIRQGAIVAKIPLRERGANRFSLRAEDAQGRNYPIEPRSFAVQRGLTAAAPPLSRSIGVVVRDEGTGRKVVEWLLRRDTPLPARTSYEFRTALALEPGGETEVIGVYLVEGEAPRPERNRTIGRIEITDSDVSRTVPAGAPVEIRLEVSPSRLLRATVFLPSLDQTFDVEVQVDTERPTIAELAHGALRERERMEEATAQMTSAEASQLRREAEALTGLLQIAEGEPEGIQRASGALRALQESLDKIDARLELPKAIDEAKSTMHRANSAATTYGSESQQRRLESLTLDIESAIRQGDLPEIERATGKLERLRFEILAAQPWFWQEWFEYLRSTVSRWSDPHAAQDHIKLGTRALAEGDYSTLRRNVVALASLAPDDHVSFANVGIRRG